MTIRDVIQQSSRLLQQHHMETPVLDVTVLLAEALGISKEKLLASYPNPVEDADLKLFQTFLNKRIAGYPVSYIRAKKEFYGLTFYVDERVLIPRPETETLVDVVLQLIEDNSALNRILDVGTGSGCIPITVKYHKKAVKVFASDISSGALEVCRKNARDILGYEIPCFQSDLFQDIPGRYNIIVSNPPYLTGEEVERMKAHGWPEPESALGGGPDGLVLIKKLIKQSIDSLTKNGYLLMEAAITQIDSIKAVMDQAGYQEIKIFKDLSGRNRLIMGQS